MDTFPLIKFLDSLAADGINLTFRDYERLYQAFRTGGQWHIGRVKNVLLALIAKSEEQQRLVARRFDKFFAAEMAMEQTLNEQDVSRVLRDLMQIEVSGEVVKRKVGFIGDGPSDDDDDDDVLAPGDNHKKWWWLLLLLLPLLVGLGMYFFRDNDDPPPPPPPPPTEICDLKFTPPRVQFIQVPVGQELVQSVTVTNECSSPISIVNSQIANDSFQNIFSYALPDTTLGPNEQLTFSVSFRPQISNDYLTALNIYHSSSDSLTQLFLDGFVEPEIPPEMAARVYQDVPFATIEPGRIQRSEQWITYAVIAAVLILLTLLWARYLYLLNKGPRDQQPDWDKTKSQFFQEGEIGGDPAPLLDDATLSELADSMGYFKSEQAGRVLNVPASVKATLKQGGLPAFDFYSKTQLRTLLILEDANAEPLLWNPVAEELARGMEKFRVPVIYGQFFGGPDKFRTADGTVYQLDDLEDQRRGILVLLFTDGKSFYRRQHTFVLEKLSTWPMVAWMDLREPRFWDEMTELPIKHNIPLFPATRKGLDEAITTFLTERGAGRQALKTPVSTVQIPAIPQNRTGAWLEYMLGDAYLWAQDCAMVQPLSQGMADALRQHFHPNLAPTQIELLYALPNTTHTDAGLHFSNEILRALRHGFLDRRSEAEQEAVMQFILQQVEIARPEAPENSLKYLSWEARKERIKLELGGDEDGLKRFGELLKTPLAGTLSYSLENYGFPEDGTDKIPLLRKPTNPMALLRLRNLKDNPLEIPSLLKQWHMAVLVLLATAALVFTTLAIYHAMTKTASNENFFINGPEHTLARLEKWTDPDWKMEVDHARITDFDREISQDSFRITFYDHQSWQDTQFRIDAWQRFDLHLDKRPINKKIVTVNRDIGLMTRVAFDTVVTNENNLFELPTWKEWLGDDAPPDREMSVAIEVIDTLMDDPNLLAFHNTLFRTGSIDVFYRIFPDRAGQWRFDTALQHIQRDLAPWMKNSQLLLWSITQEAPEIPRQLYQPFDRAVILGNEDDLSIIDQLSGILEPAFDPLVTEDTIINALAGQVQTNGKGDGLLLRRPSISRYVLHIIPTPSDATIEFLPPSLLSYRDSMLLRPNLYEVRVSHPDYYPAIVTVQIGNKDRVLPVSLRKIGKGAILVQTIPESVADSVTIEVVSDNGFGRENVPYDKEHVLKEGQWVVSARNGRSVARDTITVVDQQETEIIILEFEEEPVVAQEGTLRVELKPGGKPVTDSVNIFIRKEGETTRKLLTGGRDTIIAAGRWTVEVESPFSIYRPYSEEFEMVTDSTVILEIPLQRITGEISFVAWDSVIYNSTNTFAKYSPSGKYIGINNIKSGVILSDARLNEIASFEYASLPDSIIVEERASRLIAWDHVLAFSPDERFLIARGARHAYILQVPDMKFVQSLSSKTYDVLEVSMSPDGQYLLVSALNQIDTEDSGDGILFLWKKVGQRFVIVDTFTELKNGGFFGVSFSPNGQHLVATTSNDIRLFKFNTDVLTEIQKINSTDILDRKKYSYLATFAYTYSNDGDWSVSNFGNWRDTKISEVIIFKNRNGNLEKHSTINQENYFALCISFSPDGKYIAIGNQGDKNVKIFNFNQSKLKLYQNLSFDITTALLYDGPTSTFFSPDGNYLLGCYSNTGEKSKIKIWKIIKN